jgi:hypothetical protein
MDTWDNYVWKQRQDDIKYLLGLGVTHDNDWGNESISLKNEGNELLGVQACELGWRINEWIVDEVK